MIFKKSNLIKFLSLFFCLCVCSFLFLVYMLPTELSVIEGRESWFYSKLPLKVEIEEESIGVLSINNNKVNENIHFNMGNTVSIKAISNGSAKIGLSLFGLIPIKTVSVDILPDTEIIPSGKAIGVFMDTDGVMVLGTGYVNNKDNNISEPSEGLLKSGDLILEANGKSLESKEDLMEVVNNSKGEIINFLIQSNGKQKNIDIAPILSKEDNTWKIGVWVRDSTQGIGTVTYYNPNTGNFGALGHGVYDVDTNEIMSVKSGVICMSSLTGIKKGEKGNPGEIIGNSDRADDVGSISINTDFGLYGKIDSEDKEFFGNQTMPIALKQDVHEGEAKILSSISENTVKEYKINIESINHKASADKGMIIKITDEELISKTGGIIQGMSGSPIVQDGKVVGAVTHVFVNDPSKGYGIFIENMLKAESAV